MDALDTACNTCLSSLGGPSQNGYIESFNGKFREERLNKYWFTHPQHVWTIIET